MPSAAIDKEEQWAVVLALFILAQLGETKPKRAKVLRFIKSRGLVRFKEGDFVLRSDGEEKWMNDFSWARKDVKESGLLAMPEFGHWQLTERGREKLLALAKKWTAGYEKDHSLSTNLIAECQRLNDHFFACMVCLGRGIDITKIPNVVL